MVYVNFEALLEKKYLMLSFIILWKKWEYFQIYFESDNVPASKIKTLRALFLPDASAGKM